MLVSCITPTMPSRREWLPKARACFESLRWPNKELVIVEDEYGASGRYLTTGEKRNAACRTAKGEIILHLDDDDFSAPARISDQVSRLLESGKAVTGYHSMRFTDGRRWWKNTNIHSFAFGTSLCYRRDWWAAHQFPALTIGEDTAFAETAWRAGQLISVDAGLMMYATIHPDNTSPRVIGEGWTEIHA